MMAATRWNFPSGSNGDTITPTLAGSTAVNFAGATATLSNAQTLIGPLSGRILGSAAGQGYIEQTGLTGATAWAADMYLYLDAAHGATSYLIWGGSSSSTRSCGVHITTGRLLRIIDNSGATKWESTALPLDTWVRVSLYVTCNATTGTAELAWYLGYDTTPQQTSGTVTGCNTGASIDRIRVGLKATSTAAGGDVYISSWAYDPAATGLITPYTPPAPPAPVSVTLGADTVDAIYVGADPVDYGYLGDRLFWPPGYAALRTTVTGTTFSPEIELKIGATATPVWIAPGATIGGTDLAPTFAWGAGGAHEVTLVLDVPADLTTINYGFSSADDAGRYSPGAGYNHAAQPVTGVSTLAPFTGLKRFLSANNSLTGHLDFTGCADLEYVECFESNVQSVDLTGCDSISRLCFESNQLTELDLNPCKDSIYDLRAANTQGGTLTFTPLTGDGLLDNLYHFCVRTQTVVTPPTLAQLPVIEQWWVWSAGITTPGTPTSTVFNSCLADNNSLSQAAVDALLVYINANVPAAVGNIDLSGNTAPSGTGNTAKAALIARGSWTVTTD